MANNVEFKVLFDTSELKKAFKDIDSNLGGVQKSFSDVGKKAGVIFAGLTASIYGFAKAGQEQERAVNALNQSLKNSGNYSEEASKQLQKYAGELQKITLFGDETIVKAQSLIAAFGFEGDQLKRLTKATADLAQAKGMDLASAADVVAKSIGTSSNALGRYGISMDGATSKSEKAEIVIGKINKLFGGQAEAAAKGLGSIDRMTNALSDMAEEIGLAMAPAVERFAEMVIMLADKFNNLSPEIKSFIANGILISAVIAGVVSAIGFLGSGIIQGIMVIQKLVAVFKAVTTAMKAFNLVASLNPFVLITISIIALIAAIVLLVRNWDKLKEVFVQNSELMKKALLGIAIVAAPMITIPILIFNAVRKNFGKIPELIKKAFTDPLGFIKSAWDKFIGFIKTTLEQVGKLFSSIGSIFGGGKKSTGATTSAPSSTGGGGGDTGGGGAVGGGAVSGLIPTSGFSEEGLTNFRNALKMTADEALTAFAQIGEAFTSSVVDGIVNGTLNMEMVWQQFITNTYTMILEQLFAPITEGMSMLSMSMVEIFNNTFGLLLNPVMMFVGQAVQSFGQMFAQFILQTLGFQKLFAVITTQLGAAWTALTSNMVVQWLVSMATMLFSLLQTAIGAITAFAFMAAGAAAAAVALIPIVGPILAPIAYFATLGLVLGGIGKLAGFADGGIVPAGDSVIAGFNPGEKVLTARETSQVESGNAIVATPDAFANSGSGEARTVIVNNDFTGAQFSNGVTDEMVDDIFRRASERAAENDLVSAFQTK